MAELFFLDILRKSAPRIPIFENKNYLPADLEILASEVAISVKDAHSPVRAFVLLLANGELAGNPRSQAIALLHSPSFASPPDIMLMMIGKELLLDIENELLKSIHAIASPFRTLNYTQFAARNSIALIPIFRAPEIILLTYWGIIPIFASRVSAINSLPFSEIVDIPEYEEHNPQTHSWMYP